MKTLAATTIVRTERGEKGGLALTLADAGGHTSSVTLTGDLVSVLAGLLSEHSTIAAGSTTLTRMPSDFAVGTSLNDRVVLVRFENDIAYGLTPELAADLGYALIDEAAALNREPPRRLI